MIPELLDLAEYFIHVAGIHPHDAALQHQGIGFAGAVATREPG
jgi:hypothetical protein